MYNFPAGVYCDVRLERRSSVFIKLEDFELKQSTAKTDIGVLVRVYDGARWYYSSTTDVESIQAEIDRLAGMAKQNPNIDSDPVVKRFEVNCGKHFAFADTCVLNVPIEKKLDVVNSYIPVVKEFDFIKTSTMLYMDSYIVKHFVSSKGADLEFDTQCSGVSLRYTMSPNDLPFEGRFDVTDTDFSKLEGEQDAFRDRILHEYDYACNATPVASGIYTCVLSPDVAGVFAHESFGHKSEADFMLGDETMIAEWELTKRVGSDILSIVDHGAPITSGYAPFDDEGTATKETYLIRNGKLTGRLHSASTAAALDEPLTGNARAIGFGFEPIVRMTSTYICPGKLTKDELFAGVELGIYIESYRHGSGMSTFTIAPRLAYMIRSGKVAEPVRVSVVSGNVMKTLYEIDGVSDTLTLRSNVTGGCGKMEQFPLPVAFGGPYVRVNGLTVQ